MRHLHLLAAAVLVMVSASAPAEESGFAVGGGADFRRKMLSWQGHSDPAPVKTKEIVGSNSSPSRLTISSPFGWRSDPILGGHRRHAGVDLPGPSGARIFATGAGVVHFAGWARGYGNMVEIDHPGGVRTRFGHLDRIFVSAGSHVAQGQIIGAMGSTGRSTGPHLHYEVRVGGRPVNPLAYIGQTATSYETVWSETRQVAPRWAGWNSKEGGASLPQSLIR